MLDRLTAALDLMRPRTALRTRERIDALGVTLRELKELVKELRKAQDRGERQGQDVLAAVEALTGRVDQLQDEFRTLHAIARRDAELEDDLDQLASICDEPRIAAHVRSAVDKAPLVLDPFPHVVVHDLFPRDLYAALIRGLPPVELFGNPSGSKPQLTVPVTVGPVYCRHIWKFMAWVVIPRMRDTLVEKFRAPLEEWISANWPSLASNPFGPPMELQTGEGRIMLRRRGYEIKPHRDPKWGFLTTILYLVRKGDSAKWGTTLYSVDGDRTAMGAAPWWIEPAQCAKKVEVPFIRNSALVFLNSWGAHGASIPADAEPADLERYIYQFRIGPSLECVKALRAILPDEQQPIWAGKTIAY